MKKNIIGVDDEIIKILHELKEIPCVKNIHKAKTDIVLRLKGINERLMELIKKDDEERSR